MFSMLTRVRLLLPRAPWWYLLPAGLLLVVGSGGALAHKVNMFAFAEGDQVFVEGYFSDGKRARQSEVVVYDGMETELVRGVTDEEGAFVFKIPVQDDLRIILNAGMGHQAEYVITREELTGVAGDVSDSSGDQEGTPQVTASLPAAVSGGGASPQGINEAAIRKAVGEAIRPLMRSISELQERRSFSDIVGGIGFIVGIAGLFFYFKARRILQDGAKDKGPS